MALAKPLYKKGLKPRPTPGDFWLLRPHIPYCFRIPEDSHPSDTRDIGAPSRSAPTIGKGSCRLWAHPPLPPPWTVTPMTTVNTDPILTLKRCTTSSGENRTKMQTSTLQGHLKRQLGFFSYCKSRPCFGLTLAQPLASVRSKAGDNADLGRFGRQSVCSHTRRRFR